MRRYILTPIITLLMTIALPSAAMAEVRADAEYDLSVRGFRVGKLQLRTAYTDRAYTVRGQGRVTGIAGLFVDFRGETTSSGVVVSGGLAPLRHEITYSTQSRDFVTNMSFSRGNVSEFKAEPPLPPKSSRVAVTRSHLNNVIDPISALSIRVQGARGDTDARVCNRTLRIFDGRERYDLTLSHSGHEQISIQGYQGNVVRCNVRYRPVSGHRTDNDFVNDVASRDDVQAWFVRVPNSDFFIFYRANIPSGMGTIDITASALNLGDQTRAARN